MIGRRFIYHKPGSTDFHGQRCTVVEVPDGSRAYPDSSGFHYVVFDDPKLGENSIWNGGQYAVHINTLKPLVDYRIGSKWVYKADGSSDFSGMVVTVVEPGAECCGPGRVWMKFDDEARGPQHMHYDNNKYTANPKDLTPIPI